MDPIPFSGSPLDRASDRRSDPGWLKARAAEGLFLPFWQTRPFLVDQRAGFLPWRAEWDGATCIFLGLDGSLPLFAVDLAGESEPGLGEGGFGAGSCRRGPRRPIRCDRHAASPLHLRPLRQC